MLNAIKRKMYLRLARWLGLEAWPPGHYYSALPALGDVAADVSQRPLPVAGLHVDLEAMRLLIEGIEANTPVLRRVLASARHYQYDNEFFSGLDAIVLVHLLAIQRPQRIIEIGGGHSTALMLDAIDTLALDIRVTSIEPYPDRIAALAMHERMTLRKERVETLDPATFESLQAGDILFIDSSHVVKSGSDVLYLLFDVLPRLPAGVLIHFHDIYIPDDYPIELRQDRRAWNESYFLQGFLMYNRDFAIAFGSHLAMRNFEPVLKKLAANIGMPRIGGGSFWIKRS
jgi:predicted O-methyltransferase YrrM